MVCKQAAGEPARSSLSLGKHLSCKQILCPLIIYSRFLTFFFQMAGEYLQISVAGSFWLFRNLLYFEYHLSHWSQQGTKSVSIMLEVSFGEIDFFLRVECKIWTIDWRFFFFFCRVFESLSEYCEKYSDLIPLSFVLGFYVTIVMTRWWDQYNNIPWPDPLAVYVSAHIHGQVRFFLLMFRNFLWISGFRTSEGGWCGGL